MPITILKIMLNIQIILTIFFLDVIKEGNLKNLKILVKNGFDIHYDNDLGIVKSSRYGHLDIHTRDDESFKLACRYGHIDVIKFLINHGANVNNEMYYCTLV
jgi:ankyrin repeat protein